MGNRASSVTDRAIDGPVVVSPRVLPTASTNSGRTSSTSQRRLPRPATGSTSSSSSRRFYDSPNGLEYGDLSQFESIFRYSTLSDNLDGFGDSVAASSSTTTSSNVHSLPPNTPRPSAAEGSGASASQQQQQKPRRPEDLERALQMMHLSHLESAGTSSTSQSRNRRRRPTQHQQTDSTQEAQPTSSSRRGPQSARVLRVSSSGEGQASSSSPTGRTVSPHQPRRGRDLAAFFGRSASSAGPSHGHLRRHHTAPHDSSSNSEHDAAPSEEDEEEHEAEDEMEVDVRTELALGDYPALLRSLLQSLRRDRYSSSSSAEGAVGSSSWLLMNLATGLETVLTADRCCPVCQKMIPYDDYELHYVCCLTKPKLEFTEETLTEDKGECTICLDDMPSGSKVARLPCACMYHISCIERWFKKTQECPLHPSE